MNMMIESAITELIYIMPVMQAKIQRVQEIKAEREKSSSR